MEEISNNSNLNVDALVFTSSKIKEALNKGIKSFLEFEYSSSQTLATSMGNLFEKLVFELIQKDYLDELGEEGGLEYLKKYLYSMSDVYSFIDEVPIPNSEDLKNLVENLLNLGLSPSSPHEDILKAAHAMNYLTNYKSSEKLAEAVWNRYKGEAYYNYLIASQNKQLILNSKVDSLLKTVVAVVHNLAEIIDSFFPLTEYYMLFNPAFYRNTPNFKSVMHADIVFLKKPYGDVENYPYYSGIIDLKFTEMSPVVAYHTFNMKIQGAFYYYILNNFVNSFSYLQNDSNTKVLTYSNDLGKNILSGLDEYLNEKLITICPSLTNYVVNSLTSGEGTNAGLTGCLPPIFLFGKFNTQSSYELIMKNSSLLDTIFGVERKLINEKTSELFLNNETHFSNENSSHIPGILDIVSYVNYCVRLNKFDLNYKEFYHLTAGI